MTPNELEKKIRQCKKCPLYKTRKQAVTSRGKGKRCDILFVGQNPGKDEDKEGIPFVGRCGKLLQETLVEYKFDNYIITNIVKCLTPGNRPPSSEEISKCSVWLDEELALFKPKIIVPLGSIAMQSLTDISCGMLKASGKLYKEKYFPIPHPSYYLRNPNKQPAFRCMMKLLKKVSTK